jgi:hypothetical protein
MMASEFKRDISGMKSALWACEQQSRATYNLITTVRSEFTADLPDPAEKAFKEAVLLAIDLERKLSEVRAWIP